MNGACPVVLFNPRSSAEGKPILPMSLLALGAVLEGHHEYAIVDGNLEPDPLGAIARHLRAGARALAITVMPGPQLAQALPLSRALKARFPGVPIVWGGYFPTEHWQACLRESCVDFVVRGHGELALRDLLRHLDSGDPPRAQIAGLAWREGGAATSSGRAPVPHPGELPEWNLDRVPFERYLRETFLGRRTVGYHSSYGCPFFCNFCAVVNLVEGRWLAQNPQRVAAALEVYRGRFGVDAVEFCDNNFFVHEARCRELAERISGLGLSWWGEGRIDTMLAFTDATWNTMRGAGLRMVFLGAESGSAATLERMDKGGRLRPEQTLELVARMAEFGVVPELSFVLGAPPEPERDVEETLGFIRRVKARNPATEIILYLYTPVPLAGTLLDAAQASGFRFPDTLDEWVSPRWLEFTQRRSGRLPWLAAGWRRRLRNFERVLHAYYPTTTSPALRGWRRALLQALAGWRWGARCYALPLELMAAHRLLRYQRPETSGF